MKTPYDPDVVSRYEHETWSRCAQVYTDGFGPLTREAIGPLLDAARVGRGDRVLDVGTGPGLVAAAAAQRGADVTGIDLSEAMVAEASTRHPDITFRAISGDDLPFDDSSFDAVVGNFMLHHAARPEQVLAEACRVLRDGGRAAFTVWADLAELEAFGLFLAAVEEHAGEANLPHGPLFGVSDPGIFHEMARTAGLCGTSVERIEMNWVTPSLEPYLAVFSDWADVEKFPLDIAEAIESSVRERAEAYRTGDGFVMPNPGVLVSAVRPASDALGAG